MTGFRISQRSSLGQKQDHLLLYLNTIKYFRIFIHTSYMKYYSQRYQSRLLMNTCIYAWMINIMFYYLCHSLIYAHIHLVAFGQI